MKSSKIKNLFAVVICLVLLSISSVSMAMVEYKPTPAPEPPCLPINNGIMFLLIAGVALGAKMMYDNSRKLSVNAKK